MTIAAPNPYLTGYLIKCPRCHGTGKERVLTGYGSSTVEVLLPYEVCVGMCLVYGGSGVVPSWMVDPGEEERP